MDEVVKRCWTELRLLYARVAMLPLGSARDIVWGSGLYGILEPISPHIHPSTPQVAPTPGYRPRRVRRERETNRPGRSSDRPRWKDMLAVETASRTRGSSGSARNPQREPGIIIIINSDTARRWVVVGVHLREDCPARRTQCKGREAQLMQDSLARTWYIHRTHNVERALGAGLILRRSDNAHL